MKKVLLLPLLLISGLIISSTPLFAQMQDAPERTEGDGPYERLIIRGGTMIDGTGSPALGPVGPVIERLFGQHLLLLLQRIAHKNQGPLVLDVSIITLQ